MLGGLADNSGRGHFSDGVSDGIADNILDQFLGGFWAGEPDRMLAKAWAPLAAALDDPQRVVWMPAHCSREACRG